MIEKIVQDFLKSKNFNALLEKQRDLTGDFVLIEKTGGSERDFLKSATIAIQSYSDSLFNAATLNEKIKETMKQIISLAEVTRCDLNSDYNYTLVGSKEYRYQAVFDIFYY